MSRFRDRQNPAGLEVSSNSAGLCVPSGRQNRNYDEVAAASSAVILGRFGSAIRERSFVVAGSVGRRRCQSVTAW